eukprot:1185975-Prorocentrum_minimum.AAC.2
MYRSSLDAECSLGTRLQVPKWSLNCLLLPPCAVCGAPCSPGGCWGGRSAGTCGRCGGPPTFCVEMPPGRRWGRRGARRSTPASPPTGAA